MAGEIADFVSKHKGKIFAPGYTKKTETKRPGSVGELGKSLEQNDPETLKFIKRHDTTIHGEKPEVATKYALDNPINSHMKPETGVYEEEEMEEAKKCPKCGAANCTCQHEECKKLTSKKLKEETFSNFIALRVLEEMKVTRLDELSKYAQTAKKMTGDLDTAEAPNSAKASMGSKKSIYRVTAGGRSGGSSLGKQVERTYSGRVGDKKAYGESVGSEIHKVSPGDPDYTGGMHIGTKPKAEVATGHKPAVASTEKSKKLDKRGIKEAHHHQEPTPHLNNPSHGSGCTGHEDSMPVIQKPHADPTKIPNKNQVSNSTQPPSGVLDKKKLKKIKEDILNDLYPSLDEGLGSAMASAENWLSSRKAPSFKTPSWVAKHQGKWAVPQQAPGKVKQPKGKVKGPVAPAKQEVLGGTGGSIEGAFKQNRGKWTEGGKKK